MTIIGIYPDWPACYLKQVEIDPPFILAMTLPDHPSPISTCAFERWVASAARGVRIEYHRGFLIVDRSPGSRLAARHRRQLARLADVALRAAETGQVHLVQRRRGPFDFAYLAIKAGGLESAPAARMRQLLARGAA